ncbi:ricin B lectin domain-containing protein, partial [Crepidotus variabilis]
YYYLVKGDVFNAGFSVEPVGGSPPVNFCQKIICDSADCKTAFEGPQYEFPPFGSEAPAAPLYSCPGENIHFKITFCPNGKFPNPVAERYISSNSHGDKCLDVRDAVLANGTTVDVNTCSESSKTQKWVLDRGVTKVRIAGTNFCIDRGEPGYYTGVESTITQCRNDSQTQKWRYSDITNRIWWYGTAHSWDRPGICIDLTNANSSQVQVSNCTNGVDSQVWQVAALDGLS